MQNSSDKFNSKTTLVLGFVILLTYNELLQGGSWLTGVAVFVAIYIAAVYTNRLHDPTPREIRRPWRNRRQHKPTDRKCPQDYD